MKRYLPFAIVAAVGLLAIAAGTLLYRAKLPPVLEIPKDSSAPEKSGTDSMHVRGKASAPVTLEEFGDFECPPCSKLAPASRQLEEDYGDKLRVIFRHFPLAMHPHAQDAALAAEAAGRQERFWEMHDLLYQEQAVWSKATDVRALFSSYAGTLGLNLDRFKTDMDRPEVKERVAADQARGISLGVSGTPTIFINGRQVPPPIDAAALRTAIEAVLKPTPSP